MKIISERTRIKEVCKRWMGQYPKDYRGVGKKLKVLGNNATVVDICEIIGNDSWTATPDCSECGTHGADKIIEIGEEQDYESNTAYLCRKCIAEALAMFAREE